MTKAFLPQMKAKNHGHIVTVASALGLFSTACVEVRQEFQDFSKVGILKSVVK